MRIEAQAAAEAEAIKIRTVAAATAESIQKVNEAIQVGGESYFRYRQIELVPTIAPALADALARARLITVSGGGGGTGAAEAATQSMMNVIQTVLAAQLVAKGDLAGLGEIVGPARRDGAEAVASPTKLPARPGRPVGD